MTHGIKHRRWRGLGHPHTPTCTLPPRGHHEVPAPPLFVCFGDDVKSLTSAPLFRSRLPEAAPHISGSPASG